MDKLVDTRERILDAAEEMLRRYGPAKTTVLDVARALDMSHANVYRHFASKSALQDAVAERWLHRLSATLSESVRKKGSAAKRLEAWVLALAAVKRKKVLDDPEMFATYIAVAQDARSVVEHHVKTLTAQIAEIIRDGVAAGEFKVRDAEAAAAAVLTATVLYHHPHHVAAAGGRDNEAEIRALLRLLIAGLKAGSA
jgi:AcrR family transcriptional regulator